MESANSIENVRNMISIAKPILETIAPKIQESMGDFTESLLSLSKKYAKIGEFAE